MKNLIYFFFFFLLFIQANSMLAQTINIKNGITFSSMNFNKINLFESKIQTYSFTIGTEYLSHTWWELSSEMGYIQKGGKEKEIIENDILIELKEAKNYVHLNTTIRAKYSGETFYFYAGIGPTFDLLVDSNEFKDNYLEGYLLKKSIWGMKSEIGFNQFLNKKIKVGLNFSYLYDIDYSGKSEYNKFRFDNYILMFSLGYNLK